MEFNATLIAVIILTSLASSVLSLGAKLVYDGIKAKKNGTNGTRNSEQISVNLALLIKDIDFNNKKLAEIESAMDRQVELSIASNVHLIDLKTSIVDQTNTFRTLISTLNVNIARLESKL